MKKIFFFIFISTFCFAGESLKPTRVKTPPVIDGNLEDKEWRNVFSVSNFKTFYPDYGKNAKQKTLAYAAYDSTNLYFAFYCYDNEPNKIKTSIASRDNIRPDDWICINLDTFNDQQSLYAFYVNPNGIQSDSRYSAGVEDFSADFVWYSAGKLVPDGYTVEISIPLKSIRYAETNPVTMSIFFERFISRLLEHSSYPELKAEMGFAFLVQMAPIKYYDLESYTLFELLPAYTYSQKYNRTGNDLNVKEKKGELSLTAKYGLTSDLILDATYNPDFSQVEADAGQVDVNLRYALFYPEKRPFFLEGKEIFNFASTSISEIDPLVSLVHTRNIVNPLTGIKLTGKIGPNNTFAILYSIDELPLENLEGNYAHFPIFRYKRALSNDSYLGSIYTGRETENNFNRVGGIDGFIRINQSSTLDWNGIYSSTKFNTIDEIKNGSAVSLHFISDSRNLQYDFGFKSISENFFLETGYLYRNGITSISGSLKPKIYPATKFVSRIDFGLFSAQTYDKPSNSWETYNYASAQAYIFGSLTARLRLIYSTEIFAGQKFNTGGIAFLAGGQFNKKFYLLANYQRMQAIYYSQSPYQGYSNRFSANINYKPIDNIESVTSFTFADFKQSSDEKLIYNYSIYREKLTYQLNKYLLFRGIIEYNKFKEQLLADFLISFTYVPGTVIHLGYGSLYLKIEWNALDNNYIDSDKFNEAQRGFFFKMSYLWRI